MHRPKLWEYNTKEEDNSSNTLNDKTFHHKSKKSSSTRPTLKIFNEILQIFSCGFCNKPFLENVYKLFRILSFVKILTFVVFLFVFFGGGVVFSLKFCKCSYFD